MSSPRYEMTLAFALALGQFTHPSFAQNSDTILQVPQGGTGAATAEQARKNLGIDTLPGLTIPITVPQGGTGATAATAARTNLGAASSGANSDIKSLNGLTTPLSAAQGGTGSADGVTQAWLQSLPNVQKGGVIPPPGQPYINASGFVATSQP